MTLDPGRVGVVAAELMEYLDGLYEGVEVTVGEVLIIVEVRGAPDEDAPEGWTDLRFRCSDERGWVQRGLMHAAIDGEIAPSFPDEDEDDDAHP